jgi:hypothetical protein
LDLLPITRSASCFFPLCYLLSLFPRFQHSEETQHHFPLCMSARSAGMSLRALPTSSGSSYTIVTQRLVAAEVEAKWALEHKLGSWEVACDGSGPEGEDCVRRVARQDTEFSETHLFSGPQAGNANQVQNLERAASALSALSCGLNPVSPCIALN